MDEQGVKRALRRVAHEIIENNRGVEGLTLVGIQRRGVVLARMLQDLIEEVEGVKLPMGVLDITFYRDDLSILTEHPVVNTTDLPFQVQDAKILLWFSLRHWTQGTALSSARTRSGHWPVLTCLFPSLCCFFQSMKVYWFCHSGQSIVSGTMKRGTETQSGSLPL